MLIFILGYMAAGKTTFAFKLAEKLGYRFIDMDDMLELSSGYSIADFFERFGEDTFRIKERELLQFHLTDENTIIATGGGTPCFFDNMDRMNQAGLTIYIRVTPEIVIERLKDKISRRPLLKHIPPEELPSFIKNHMHSRETFYRQAKMVIDADNFDVREILSLINP